MKFTGEFFVPFGHGGAKNQELEVEHKQRYHSICSLVKNKSVLDIASGEGYGSDILAEHASMVIGVEINNDLVTHARSKYNKKNLDFKQGSVDGIPLDDHSVDIIVSFETIEHVDAETQRLFLQEIKRVLKKDGTLIISTPNKKNYTERYNYTNEHHIHELDREEFISLLETHFHYINIYDQGFEIVSLICNKKAYRRSSHINLPHVNIEAYNFQGKYLIAVCSELSRDISSDISSVVIESEKCFFKQVDRIFELQHEVEELGTWGTRSSEDVTQKQQQIKALEEKLQSANAAIKSKELELQQLTEQESALTIENFTTTEQLKAEIKKTSDLERKLNTISEQNSNLNQQIKEKNNEVASQIKKEKEKNAELSTELQVLQSLLRSEEAKTIEVKNDLNRILTEKNILQFENEQKTNHVFRLQTEKKKLEDQLSEVYTSEGYKLLSIYYRFKGKYLPYNSKRYNKLKSWYYFLRGKKSIIPPVTPLIVSPDPYQINETTVGEQINGVEFPISFPVFEKPLISIIIPVYNNWEFTKKCLTSIFKFHDSIPIEIIIADDQSNDETTLLENYFINVKHLKNKENLGYIKNVNNAALEARGEYLLTINNDTTVTEGWIINLLKIMEQAPEAGLVGSKLVYPDGTLQEAGGIIWKDASGWNYGHSGDPNSPEFNYVKEVDYISGASHLIRKDIWYQLGGLDERYAPAYYDDSDLAFQIRQLGYKVIYQPLSVVIHHEGKSHGTDISSGTKKYQEINKIKFLTKWEKELNNQFNNAENVFWARDRSRSKKTIVIIDHYVPHFDKDAGSRFTFSMLKLLVNIGFNVKFIGDNFYRHEPYTTELQQMGIEVLFGSWYRDNWQQWILDNKKYIDLFYINRPHISIKYIDFIKENTNSKIIYFGHDLHFLRELRQYSIEKNENLLESSEKWKKIEADLIMKSDKVVTVSSIEKEIIQKEFNKQHTYLIPTLYFRNFNDPISNFNERNHLFFIGGFNHKPNVDALVWFCEKIFPQITRSIPGIKLIAAGSKPTEEIARLAEKNIEILFDISDEQLNELYSTAKIVILPLRYGAGVKGKTIEALYHGIPIVSTSIGIEGLEKVELVSKGYDSAEEFSNRIIELYNNIPELERISSLQIEYAKENLSEEKAIKTVSEIMLF